MAEQARIAVTLTAPRTIAGIGVFRDRAPCLAALHAEFGVTVPITPRFVQAGPVTLSCLAPTRYLASASADACLPVRLANKLAGLAAITDQSDMWATFALSGLLVRELLARLVPVDLTTTKFGIGDLALTRASHVDVRLWRLADHDYELAVTRSYAEDFYTILEKQSRSLVLA